MIRTTPLPPLDARPRRQCFRAPGFSLTELLIVISIMALLMGMVSFAGYSMMKGGKVSRTQVMLESLVAISDEYQLKIGHHVDHREADSIDETIDEFVMRASQIDICRDMLKSLGAEDTVSLETDFYVKDPWGNRLRYARRVNHSEDPGWDDVLPEYPRPFFASAGPDGEWGNHALLLQKREGDSLTEEEERDADFAADNLYSFQGTN